MSHRILVTEPSKGTLRRARWSSVRRLLLACAGATLFNLPVGAQAPTAAQLDSVKQRLDDAEAMLALLREQLATENSIALRTRSRVALEFSGRALVNAFSNSARTNNVDVPVFARPDSGSGPQGGGAMSIRQTRLAIALSVHEVAGGTFTGDLDVDFFGGQVPSSGGRTFPLLRLRTARGTIAWRHGEVMMGQDQPLIAALDPISLASVGTPGFTAAGNLWLWLPQVRATVQSTGPVRIGLQAAVLAPTSGDPNGVFDTQFDAAERTNMPYLEGQLRAQWGEDAMVGTVALGVHAGRIADALDVERDSRAVTLTVLLPIGSRLELRGEAFDGQALRGLGGGGIGQGLGLAGTPVRTRGGWGQLNLRATSRLLVGVGTGMDDPEDADLAPGGRTRNTTSEFHLHWRPSGPIVLGAEWRQTKTEFTAGSRTNQHLNLAFGFEF